MLEDEKVLQAALLQRAVPDLRDRDKVKAVVLLSNGLDLPFSMHIIQVTIQRKQKKNNEKKTSLFFSGCECKRRWSGGSRWRGAISFSFLIEFFFFTPLLSDNFPFYNSTCFRQVSLLNSSVPQVGDLCWSSERDSSMQALMRELFYFNYQVIT